MALSPYQVAERLVACALAAVDNSGDVTIQRSGVVPGAIAWDDCQCGQLVISEVRRYPSGNFPEEGAIASDACGEPWIVVEYVMSITRCVPSPDDNGNPPSMAALGVAAEQLSDDKTKIRRAVYCCLNTLFDAMGAESIEAFELGQQPSVGPEGGCAGSELTILVGWTNDCGCD